MMGHFDTEIQILDKRIDQALKHIESPFHWCGLTVKETVAVQFQCRGYSAQRSGEIVGISRHAIRKRLDRAVEKINAAEDWNIKVSDLADVLLKLIQEELDGN